jgi:hypothetical protein
MGVTALATVGGSIYEILRSSCDIVIVGCPFPQLVKPASLDPMKYAGVVFMDKWFLISATEATLTITCDRGISFPEVQQLLETVGPEFEARGYERLEPHDGKDGRF